MSTSYGRICLWISNAGDESQLRRIDALTATNPAAWVDKWRAAIKRMRELMIAIPALMVWCLAGRPDDTIDLDFDAMTQANAQGWNVNAPRASWLIQQLASMVHGLDQLGRNTKVVSYHGMLSQSTRTIDTPNGTELRKIWMGIQWGKLSRVQRDFLLAQELAYYRCPGLPSGELEIVIDASKDEPIDSPAHEAAMMMYNRGIMPAVETIPSRPCFLVAMGGGNCYVMADTMRDYEAHNFSPAYNVLSPTDCAHFKIQINIMIGTLKEADAADVCRWLSLGYNVWIDRDAAFKPWMRDFLRQLN